MIIVVRRFIIVILHLVLAACLWAATLVLGPESTVPLGGVIAVVGIALLLVGCFGEGRTAAQFRLYGLFLFVAPVFSALTFMGWSFWIGGILLPLGAGALIAKYLVTSAHPEITLDRMADLVVGVGLTLVAMQVALLFIGQAEHGRSLVALLAFAIAAITIWPAVRSPRPVGMTSLAH